MNTSSCRRYAAHCLRKQPAYRRHSTRPTFAPKTVLDIKHIRQSPGLYEQNCIDRNYKSQSRNSWKILELHEQWQQLQRDARKHREQNNAIRRQLAEAASNDSDAPKTELLEEAKKLKQHIETIEEQENGIQEQIEQLALGLPNLSSQHTPSGDEPILLEYINKHPNEDGIQRAGSQKSHVDIGTSLDLLDFTGSATTSGWGWYFLKNEAALLEQALIQYALSTAMKHGWKVVSPPSIVYSHIAAACGFQPRDQNDEQQIYNLSRPEKDAAKPSLCLAGTAEIPLAGMKANTTFSESDLPLKVIGASRCYRAEAGARGVDTKGLYRVHEFTKVEMFGWTLPDPTGSGHFDDIPLHSYSEALFEEMVDLQKTILSSLGLHCRMLEMPSTELGASATRKIDIEAFFLSRKEKDEGWGEVTSASICTDYQARRLNTRVKLRDQAGKKGGLTWPHTVNGTAVAVPRVLAAIMENGWDEESGTIVVPEVLRPWMGGLERVGRKA